MSSKVFPPGHVIGQFLTCKLGLLIMYCVGISASVDAVVAVASCPRMVDAARRQCAQFFLSI